MTFLSPHAGTSPVPMNAKVTPDNKADRGSTLLSALPYAVGVFGVAFLASCITASIMTPVQNSDATTQVNIQSNAVAYYVNIASGSATGVISKDVQATYAGTRGLITDTLSIESNTPQGYQIYVSMANTTNGQKLVNTTDSTKYMSPVGVLEGDENPYSLTSPGNLSTANTWGVAVAGSKNSAFSTDSEYASDSAVLQTTKFAPVPANGKEQLLYSNTSDTATSGPVTHTLPVYYGYYATSALPSGTYQNTVLYTAYAEATDQSGGVAVFSGSLDYKNGGTLDITTSLYTDRTIKASEVSVTVSDGTTNKACTIANDAAISKVSAGTNDSVTITCSAPTWDKPGNYTVSVDIDNYAHHSSGSVFYDTDGITVAGTTIKTMQGMTSAICTAWDDVEDASNYDSTNHAPYATTGNAARTYSYGNGVTEAQIQADPTNTDYWNATVAGAAQMTNINSDVPETYLKDTRDDNWYRIRKLADGNCWMTENLRLVFAADGTNSVGVIDSNGDVVAQNPVVTINEDNSNVGKNANGGTSASKFVTGTGTGSFAEKLAYTETSTNKTVWGATDGDSTPHPTGSSVNASNEASNRANTYSRSLYRARTISTLDGDAQQYGVYYNWKAATAGTSDNYTTQGANATDSICPAGWRMPTDNNFNALIVTTYGGNDLNTGDRRVSLIAATNASYKDYHTYAMADALRRAPLSFPLSGYYSYASADLSGQGAWWSSTSYLSALVYRSYFYSGNLDSQGADRKGSGFAVRCIAQ